jgi:hypothetical protein
MDQIIIAQQPYNVANACYDFSIYLRCWYITTLIYAAIWVQIFIGEVLVSITFVSELLTCVILTLPRIIVLPDEWARAFKVMMIFCHILIIILLIVLHSFVKWPTMLWTQILFILTFILHLIIYFELIYYDSLKKFVCYLFEPFYNQCLLCYRRIVFIRVQQQ